MKTVYSYDPDTKRYAGTAVAFESPEEDGVYHLPAYTVEVEPPAFDSTKQQAVWNGERWNVLQIPAPKFNTVEATIDPWAQYQGIALKLLLASNEIMTYVLDAVVLGATTFDAPDVVAYVKWRALLKAILLVENGDPNEPFPEQPPFPTGVVYKAEAKLPKKG